MKERHSGSGSQPTTGSVGQAHIRVHTPSSGGVQRAGGCTLGVDVAEGVMESIADMQSSP